MDTNLSVMKIMCSLQKLFKAHYTAIERIHMGSSLSTLPAELFWGNIKLYTFIISHFQTLEDTYPFNLHS